MTLEQSLEPNFRPPKPFDGLIKGELFKDDHAFYLNCMHGFQGYRTSSILHGLLQALQHIS